MPLAEHRDRLAHQAQQGDLFALFASLEQLGDKPDFGQVKELLRALASAAAGLDRLDPGARSVEQLVRALAGKVRAPGRLVDAALKPSVGDGSNDHQGLAAPPPSTSPEPWPEEVDWRRLLDDLEATFCRFLVLPGRSRGGAGPLDDAHLSPMTRLPISPLLALTSPEKRCGKIDAADVLIALVGPALPASNITPAALFRAVERFQPTLLIDEADTFLRDREELRGVLNSGHTRETAFVVRTAGDDHEPRASAPGRRRPSP